MDGLITRLRARVLLERYRADGSACVEIGADTLRDLIEADPRPDWSAIAAIIEKAGATMKLSKSGATLTGKAASSRSIVVDGDTWAHPSTRPDYPPSFAVIWSLWRSMCSASGYSAGSKANAYKAAYSALKGGASYSDMLAAAEEYTRAFAGPRPPSPTPQHCSTFFGGGRTWEDYVPDGEAMGWESIPWTRRCLIASMVGQARGKEIDAGRDMPDIWAGYDTTTRRKVLEKLR